MGSSTNCNSVTVL